MQAYGEEKTQLKKDFDDIQTKIFKQDIAGGGHNKLALQLASWKPFSNESNTWFDPYWMYGVDKFDIVIGNPPYVFTRDVDFGPDFKDYVNREYFSSISLPNRSRARQSGKINLFAVFLLKGKRLITNKGSLIYIIPNNILRGTVYDVIRYELLMNNDIKSIVDLGAGVFSKVTASTILLQIGNKSDVSPKTNVLTDVISLAETKYKQKEIQQDIFIENTSYTFNIMLNAVQLQLSNKIKRGKKELGSFCVDIIEGIVAHKYLILSNKGDNCFDLIEGKDIKRFAIRDSSNFIVWNKDEIHRTRPDYLWKESKKIVMQRISGGTMPLVAGIDKEKRKAFASTNSIVLVDDYKNYYEFFTCLLNSKILNWYYANNFSNNSNLTVNISKTFLETLPIKIIKESKLQLFKDLHHKLEDTYGTPSFEQNYALLNKIIYKIYELTFKEVKIIDPEFKLTEKEYDNYQIN
ncbi:Eco57I restriction-modification methylase domain-containing protein [Marinicella gelatinilytica]|uniref:Eco57I restriction-modification methylase domain-containing protein n=1 Tax=Marinicella gelatinilytica TaxID=2996017 RepID=UPI002260EB9B|nr:TaqI-like C-terminal specificity domain-containing protein [Marinicella gelatinilytica]MCX7545997.1 Eco57I restriction-modification methylase domain-containing protein [Marinicella gelatinilytica]